MSSLAEPEAQLHELEPALLQEQADTLRQRSRLCSDLANTSLTAEARNVLSSLAEELCKEADQLDDVLGAMAAADS